jgi:hypothetical protein
MHALRCSRSHILTRSTHMPIIDNATALASATITDKLCAQAHAQRDAEISGDPGITAIVQGSTQREPLS